MSTSEITKPVFLNETGERIADALEQIAATSPGLTHNGAEYTNIPQWLASKRDTKRYTVIEPRYASSSLSACTRTDDAAGLECTPSTATTAGRDDFKNESVCLYWECNAWLDEDGKQHVYAIRGQDNMFTLTPGASPTGGAS